MDTTLALHCCPVSSKSKYTFVSLKVNCKGNRAFADLRYGEEVIISPSTLIVHATKGYLGIYTLHIPPEVL